MGKKWIVTGLVMAVAFPVGAQKSKRPLLTVCTPSV
jgi:hypothetical protein